MSLPFCLADTSDKVVVKAGNRSSSDTKKCRMTGKGLFTPFLHIHTTLGGHKHSKVAVVALHSTTALTGTDYLP